MNFLKKNLLIILAVISVGFLSSYIYADSAAGVLRVTRGGTGITSFTEGQFLIGKNIDTMQATSSMSMDSAGNVTVAKQLIANTLVISSAVADNLALGNYWLSGDGDDEGIIIDSDGNIGIGTTSPATVLDVNGLIKVIQNSTTTCSVAIQGAIHFSATSTKFWGCNGTNWVALD